MALEKCDTNWTMNILNMLAELRIERQRLDEAILVIERLAVSAAGKRRGRPPKWMAAAKSETVPETKPKTRRFSAATKRRMAAAQKRRWAARKAQSAAA
jgi:hypothetical protein